ncbi:CRISPR-associated protein Cas5 [Lactobacillus sp. UCMA15818]|uniref:CRISPR-associated protein Cas5 n=2 Tax=Lactobacillales TaxID=186826 RepID=UPI0025B00535|nr:CRISPR-associated protein Cas5 [Lactobacillus sp. UCMA15818]MDN2452381.1 CRISPR-associated protein Cas5 [Lactobacillus sp. UCMA15818]
MRAIKLKVYQQTANYKIPISYEFRESYPLPPFSTVIGMVHYLCNFDSYHPMKVSVQGSHISSVNDLYTRYEFNNGTKYDAKRHQLTAEGMGIGRGIGNVQLLVDVNLVLHVVPENQGEVEFIYDALKNPREFPNLGRREDLAVFESVEIVELGKKLEKNVEFATLANFLGRKNWAAYVPIDELDDDSHENMHQTSLQTGTKYRINKVYTLNDLGRDKVVRKWEKYEVLYTNFTFFKHENYLLDSEGDFVFIV